NPNGGLSGMAGAMSCDALMQAKDALQATIYDADRRCESDPDCVLPPTAPCSCGGLPVAKKALAGVQAAIDAMIPICSALSNADCRSRTLPFPTCPGGPGDPACL